MLALGYLHWLAPGKELDKWSLFSVFLTPWVTIRHPGPPVVPGLLTDLPWGTHPGPAARAQTTFLLFSSGNSSLNSMENFPWNPLPVAPGRLSTTASTVIPPPERSRHMTKAWPKSFPGTHARSLGTVKSGTRWPYALLFEGAWANETNTGDEMK